MNQDPMTPQPNLTTQEMMQQQHQQNMQMQQMQMQQMQQQQMQMQSPQKIHNRTKSGAALWAFFLGGLGAHKFYLGQGGQGILYLLFCWTFIPVCIAFLEMIVYLSQTDADFDKKYNYA